jgi:hypothetical protein
LRSLSVAMTGRIEIPATASLTCLERSGLRSRG